MRVIERHTLFRRALGSVLYDQRIARNWSQDATAFSIGVTSAAYRAWESGRNFPSMDNLLLLAATFGTPAHTLMAAAERRMAWAPRPRKRRGRALVQAQALDTSTQVCYSSNTATEGEYT